MIGHEERRRLMMQYGGNAACRAAVAAKCAVCLGMLSLIASIGSYEEPTGRTAREQLASLARVSPSIAAAQKTFNDRRSRIRSASTTAGTALVSAASASVEVHNGPLTDVETVMLRRASD